MDSKDYFKETVEHCAKQYVYQMNPDEDPTYQDVETAVVNGAILGRNNTIEEVLLMLSDEFTGLGEYWCIKHLKEQLKKMEV